jgi:hypothetical protein
MQPRLYRNKNTAQLLRYRTDIVRDIEFCELEADKLGFGAASDYYRRRAKDSKDELARIDAELAHKNEVH